MQRTRITRAMRILSFLVFVFGLPLLSFGQLNVSVIYHSSITQPEGHQTIIDQFNTDRGWLQSPFDRLRWLNGYGFGLRYKVDRIAFNLRWENQLDRITALVRIRTIIMKCLNNAYFLDWVLIR